MPNVGFWCFDDFTSISEDVEHMGQLNVFENLSKAVRTDGIRATTDTDRTNCM